MVHWWNFVGVSLSLSAPISICNLALIRRVSSAISPQTRAHLRAQFRRMNENDEAKSARARQPASQARGYLVPLIAIVGLKKR